jgi:hydrogenase maturation factor
MFLYYVVFHKCFRMDEVYAEHENETLTQLQTLLQA